MAGFIENDIEPWASLKDGEYFISWTVGFLGRTLASWNQQSRKLLIGNWIIRVYRAQIFLTKSVFNK